MGPVLKLVTIAHIIRARGNKGEVAAVPLSSQPDRAENVYVNETPMRVESAWMHGDQIVFKFAGIDTISEAEKLAGAEVAIPFEQRATLDQDEYFESDLIGCEVLDTSGRSLGLVTSFEETGAAPLLHIGEELLIPFAKSICVLIDPSTKKIVINPPAGLLDLNLPGT